MPGWLITHDMWGEIFALGAPLVEKMLRPMLVYAFLVVVLRVFGKRELAQLNPFDLVVLLSLSNTVQNAIIGNDNSLTGGLVGAFTLLAMNYLVVRFLFRHRRLDQIFEGRPDGADRAWQIGQAGPGEGTADPRGTDDGAAPPGFESLRRGGALRSGARRARSTSRAKTPPIAKLDHDEMHEATERSCQRQARCAGAGTAASLTYYNRVVGGMGEWLKPAVLKTVCGATRTGVRIPLPPPKILNGSRSARAPNS